MPKIKYNTKDKYRSALTLTETKIYDNGYRRGVDAGKHLRKVLETRLAALQRENLTVMLALKNENLGT